MDIQKIADRIVKKSIDSGEGKNIYYIDAELDLEIFWDNIRGLSYTAEFYGKNVSIYDMKIDLPNEVYDKIQEISDSIKRSVYVDDIEVRADSEEEAKEKFLTEIRDKENWSSDFQIIDELHSIDIGSDIAIENVNIISVRFYEEY